MSIMSMREVQRRYNELMKSVREDSFYTDIDLENRVNVYTCRRGHRVKTIDVDAGVTPAFISCGEQGCPDTSHSSFYKDTAPHLDPTVEWYRPSLKDCQKMRSKNPALLEHALMGGLLKRPRRG